VTTSLRYDVLGVNIKTGATRFLGADKSANAADGVVSFAVYRLGVETEFYVAVPAGSYVEGEPWTGLKQEVQDVQCP